MTKNIRKMTKNIRVLKGFAEQDIRAILIKLYKDVGACEIQLDVTTNYIVAGFQTEVEDMRVDIKILI